MIKIINKGAITIEFVNFVHLPDLGNILKAAREDLDLSQIQVMAQTGIHNKTLSGYENNVAEPDLQTLATLARLYGLSIDSILKLTPDQSVDTAQEKRLIKFFRILPEEKRQDVMIQVEALAKFWEQNNPSVLKK